MLQGKTALIGVCGGIAAYKVCELISRLRGAGADAVCVMTRSAAEFITPLTLGTLTQNNVYCDMFAPPANYEVEHVSLAKRADIIVIIPATANIIGKLASGIADDMLTATVTASAAPKLIAPAMNTQMYENPVVQKNINTLTGFGYEFVPPKSGRLACGDVGCGALADIDIIFGKIEKILTEKKDLAGKKVVVTAGPTREAIDKVRFITNHSSGKMGYAVARAAYNRGADVVLISGRVALPPVYGVKTVYVDSALDMYDAVSKHAIGADIIVKSAAVGDFRPVDAYDGKLKKDKFKIIELTENPDILAELGRMDGRFVLVGFAMETENMEANTLKKMKEKNCDIMVANDLNVEGAGFGMDTNVVTIFEKNGSVTKYDIMSKDALADIILDKAAKFER